MSKAYATKDQMKVWKSAETRYKDDPERATHQVMLTVKEEKNLQEAYLVASDGYQLMKRNICIDEDDVFSPHTSAIPKMIVEKAEKIMKPGDRAYFEEGKIIVKQPLRDHNGDVFDYKTVAELPYVEQLDMFHEFETSIQKGIKSDAVSRTVILNAKILKTVVEQLRSDDDPVYVNVTLRGSEDVVVFKAFKDDETKQITAAVMPIRGDRR